MVQVYLYVIMNLNSFKIAILFFFNLPQFLYYLLDYTYVCLSNIFLVIQTETSLKAKFFVERKFSFFATGAKDKKLPQFWFYYLLNYSNVCFSQIFLVMISHDDNRDILKAKFFVERISRSSIHQRSINILISNLTFILNFNSSRDLKNLW